MLLQVRFVPPMAHPVQWSLTECQSEHKDQCSRPSQPCSFTVRWGPGEETQAASRRVLLHPDLSDHCCPEEDAAHWPQHVHSRRPGAHFFSQETLQSCKRLGKKTKHTLQQSNMFLLYSKWM